MRTTRTSRRLAAAPRWAFAALALSLMGATCSNRAADDKSREQAAIHYDLGVQAMQSCDSRAALGEYRKAVELDPNLDVAQNALGLTYHLSFGQPEDAIRHYQRALELNPKFSEACTNLANVYLDQGRYDEAVALYERALSDMLYKTPHIAENNLGWALYKKGQVQQGIDHIRSALIANPKFCLGHRNLGLIFDETTQPQKAAESFGRFAKYCPDSPDAHFRYGMSLLKLGDSAAAKKELKQCVDLGREEPAAQKDGTKRCQGVQELATIDQCTKYINLLEEQQ